LNPIPDNLLCLDLSQSNLGQVNVQYGNGESRAKANVNGADAKTDARTGADAAASAEIGSDEFRNSFPLPFCTFQCQLQEFLRNGHPRPSRSLTL